MSFRKFGGLRYNAKHNAVSSNFNISNNLVIKKGAEISNNLKVTNDLLVQGDTDVCGNLTAYNMFLSSGNNYSTQPNAVVPKSYVDSIATGYTPGIGLYTSQQGTTTYLNVDSSLNFLTGIDASNNGTLKVGTESSTLDLGSIDTSVNIAGNSYVYTPYSLGSTFSPQIILITSGSSSTQITFTWTIPTLYQNISSSFQNINATLYAKISDKIKTYQVITSSTMGINITTLNNIVITNQSQTNNSQSGNTFTYYNQDFSSMQDSSSNQLILWYTNYSPYPNVSYAGYTAFASIGTPSSVLFNYGAIATQNTDASLNSGFSVTNGTVTLQCYVQYVDSTSSQTKGPPYITSYQIPAKGYSSSGSNNRYPESVSDSGLLSPLSKSTDTDANVNTKFTVSNMYPDSSYNFSVQAKNGSNSQYGPLGYYYNYSTPPPSYPSATFVTPSLLFNSSGKKYTYSNATEYKFVVDNSQVYYDIINSNKISSGFVSNNIITAVQKSGIYGKNSSTSSLNVSASLGSVSTNVNVTSFETGPSFTSNSNGILVTATTFDAYFKGNNYNQGFYLDCSTNMTISDGYAFGIPTSTLFIAALSCSGNGVNPNSNYSFYIDNINLNPSFNSIQSFTIYASSDNTYYSNQVSGIWVLNKSKNPVFSVTNLKLNNMGDYFYASPLVTYNITGGASLTPTESTVTGNISTVYNGQFSNPIIINNSKLTDSQSVSSVSSSYQTNISLSITFNNLFGQGSQTSLPSINVICDQPSYNLITNTLATQIQNLGTLTSGYKGYRVWSANVDQTMNPSGIVPYPYIVSGTNLPNGITQSSDTGYVSQQYDNSWNIATNTYTNQELLVADGGFTTNNTYYLNYSTYNGNGNLNSNVNYSGLSNTVNSGLKFATFAWNISTNLVGSLYINFVIKTNTTLYQSTTNTHYYFDSNLNNPLYLFYRFEYKNDFTKTGWGEIGTTTKYYPNTTWISCNYTTTSSTINLNAIQSSILCNFNNVLNVYWYDPRSVNNNSTKYTFKAYIPSSLNINNNSTLYLRIGIPDNQNTKITDIQAYVSNS